VVVRTPRPRTLLDARTEPRPQTNLARYGFAATRARGMALDLDSGVGCGAAVIAAAQSVTFLIAFDISSPALAFGKGS
jgi:methylase of polypeptide subunit release factors